jgi:hypothetical protein
MMHWLDLLFQMVIVVVVFIFAIRAHGGIR